MKDSSFYPLTGTIIKNSHTIGILAHSMVDLCAAEPYFVTLRAHDYNDGIMTIMRITHFICWGCPAISSKASVVFSIEP